MLANTNQVFSGITFLIFPEFPGKTNSTPPSGHLQNDNFLYQPREGALRADGASWLV